MGIEFCKSQYYKAQAQDPNFADDRAIASFAKEHPQFHYGNVSFQSFCKEYSEEKWMLRKVIAIPYALLTGILRTIYDLIVAVLKLRQDFQSSKLACYRAARDLQEGAGWLVTLFNDKYGSYLIQKSYFHRQCYDSIEAALPKDKPDVPPIPKRPTAISLQAFIEKYSKASAVQRERLIQSYHLTEIVNEIEKTYKEGFVEALKRMKPEYLSRFKTVTDFTVYYPYSVLKYALMSDEEFNQVTLEQVKGITLNQYQFIQERLQKHSVMEKAFEIPEDIAQLTLVQFYNNGFKYHADSLYHINPMIPVAFLFAKDEHLKGLSIHLLTEEQIKHIFLFSTPQRKKERLALFADDHVAEAINFGKLQGSTLENLSEGTFKLLNIERLSPEQSKIIFSLKTDSTQDRQRFAYFKPEDVQKAIEKGTLQGEYRLGLLSNAHLSQLKLSQLSYEQIKALFPVSKDVQAAKERFKLIGADEVQKALVENKLLDAYHLNLISDEQLKKVRLSAIHYDQVSNLFKSKVDATKEKERFALLDAQDVQEAMIKGVLQGMYQLHLLSDEDLQHLELSKLPKVRVEELFIPTGKGEEDKRRFALISAEEVKKAIEIGLVDRSHRLLG